MMHNEARLPASWNEWINARDCWYHTQIALEHAMRAGSEEMVESLLQAMPDLEIRYPAILHKVIRQFMGFLDPLETEEVEDSVARMRSWYETNLKETE